MHTSVPHGPYLFLAQDQILASSVMIHGQCKELRAYKRGMEIQVPSNFANTWIYLSNSASEKKKVQSYTPGCAKLLCHAGCFPYLCFPFKDKKWRFTPHCEKEHQQYLHFSGVRRARVDPFTPPAPAASGERSALLGEHCKDSRAVVHCSSTRAKAADCSWVEKPFPTTLNA